jgi:hypothetical protein
MDSISGLNPLSLTPGVHPQVPTNEFAPGAIQTFQLVEKPTARHDGSDAPGDMTGMGQGGKIGDMTGEDKGFTGVINLWSNPLHRDMKEYVIANLVANSNIPEPPARPQELAPELVTRYWIADEKDPQEPREVPKTPLYPMNIHEINVVDAPVFELDSNGQNEYMAFEQLLEELDEDKKDKEEEKEAESSDSFLAEEIMVDEAFSWKGHITQHHYSPETLHANSINMVTSFLPFLLPISRH